MLSYRHAFHAGNHADVLKHFVLVQLLEYLNQKDKPYWYIDTHAGAGCYALDEAFARKNAEYEEGVGRLLGRKDMPSELKYYLRVVRDLNSPAASCACIRARRAARRRCCAPDDQMRLFELHPADSQLPGRRPSRPAAARAGAGAGRLHRHQRLPARRPPAARWC